MEQRRDLDKRRRPPPAAQGLELGIGGIDEILPAGEIARRVMEEAERTIARLASLAGRAAA
jgi:hypothetical protein